MEFQAKDIQRYVQIPKYRYDYLSTKLAIKPEIDEVEGTGHTHLYSFKNLMQFAYAHHANILGLSPKAIVEMLSLLDELEERDKENNKFEAEVYEPHKYISLTLYRLNYFEHNYYMFGTDEDRLSGDIDVLNNYYETVVSEIDKLFQIGSTLPSVSQKLYDPIPTKFLKEILSSADGYIAINLGRIKEDIAIRIPF